jgi:uncharacterized protein YndB with AHSA1/START domain
LCTKSVSKGILQVSMATHSQEIIITEPVKLVWNALTTASIVRQWTDSMVDSTWHKHSPITYSLYDEVGKLEEFEGQPLIWTGLITELVEYKLLKIIYPEAATHGISSETYELEVLDQVITRLRFTGEYTSQQSLSAYCTGTQEVLQRLTNVLQDRISLTASVAVEGTLADMWNYWNFPSHMRKWYRPTDDWYVKEIKNDFQVGGSFVVTMADYTDDTSFNFVGRYTLIAEQIHVAYITEDGRKVTVEFKEKGDLVEIIQTFDMDLINSKQDQLFGWQSILNHFKEYVECQI